ncbi:hypothetical protein SMAC4_13426 [Sordaria macrospora]|uniref:uncharacterized protein n=1 Tax=Sordaria macrospora TaxID=5147 RepID=UPI002B2A7310|nr:hypothetical protein SMAC4_13426 [Sordaria macrospora]
MPLHSTFFALPNWNESLTGMNECCAPNKVHIYGEGIFKDCVLWCLIPDSIISNSKLNGNLVTTDTAAVGEMMRSCVKDKGDIQDDAFVHSHQVNVKFHHSDSGAGSRISVGGSRTTTLLGVGVWALLVVGLLV